MEYLDDTVKSSEDVEAATGLPTLGTVLKMKGDKGRSEIYRLVAVSTRAGRQRRHTGTLRTNLDSPRLTSPSGRSL